MKKTLAIGGLAIVAATTVIWQIRTRSAPPVAMSPAAESSQSNAPLGVETFMRDVDHHRGRVQVEGVVTIISATNQTLGLIDLREFQTCGLERCAAFTLPVRWTGTMPDLGQFVRAGGEAQEAQGRLVFVAEALEKTQLPPAKTKR